MKLFLTTDLPDTYYPITCEVLEGWNDWLHWSRLVVAIEPPVEILWCGRRVKIEQLILLRINGIHQPSEFFEKNDFVDMLAPAGSLEGEFSDTRLGYYGIVHQTMEDAQQDVPSRCGWRKES